MSEDESAVQRCPRCQSAFRVMADEAGMHPCPRCGFFPREARDEEPEP